MADSTVLINGQSVTDGYNATASSTIDVELSDSSGSNVWTVTCIGSDEGHTTSQPTITLSQITKTGTIVLPSGSGTFIFRSKVNPGMETEHSSTFGVFVRTTNASLRKFAVGLGTEGSQSYGQIPIINALVDEVDTLAAGGGGGSYTAGDGLTLTGSDFDIDLTDTTKFTTSGAASRAVVTDISGGITVGGFTQSSGTFNVDAGGEAISLVTLDNVSFGAGDGIQLTATGSVGISGGTAINVGLTTPTTDALAPAILVAGSDATTFATGTAANKTGGAIILEAGRGKTPGTDPAGPIYIGLGDEVAGVTDIENGIKFGTGAAVGTPGAADYVPYTTAKGSLNVRYDRGCLNIGMVAAQTSAEPLYLYSNNLNQYAAIGNAGISMVVGGSTVVDISSASGATTIGYSGVSQFQSTGAACHLIAPAGSVASLNGDVQFRCGNRTAKFQNYGASEDRFVANFPADTSLSADGLTTIATVTVGTSRPVSIHGVIHVWDASMNVFTSKFWLSARNVAGTVTSFNVTKTEAGSGGSMASCTTDLPGTGAGTVLLRASRPAGVACTASVTYWVES